MGVGRFIIVAIAVLVAVVTTTEGALTSPQERVDKAASLHATSNEAIEATSNNNLRFRASYSGSGDEWWGNLKKWFKNKFFFWKRSKKVSNRRH
ncbi:unnamed protein product [Phytophthora lilii]|uniref:Unnamed protein product n=1 Tax=Phytophthora lilii TaxID=2077276 RepID=A0A9W6TDC1_9STRA|nr:unnamed protein product [Phytophthora lilii]